MDAVGLRIREAGPRDALELLDLRRRVVAEGRWFIGTADEYTPSIDDLSRRLAEVRGTNTSTVRIARRNGALVGFIELRPPPFQRTRHVVKMEIAVDAAHRGAGIGRALLTEAMAWAEASPDVHKVGLAVFADNARALALYQALGFIEEGHRLREYRMEDGTWRDDVLLYRFVG